MSTREKKFNFSGSHRKFNTTIGGGLGKVSSHEIENNIISDKSQHDARNEFEADTSPGSMDKDVEDNETPVIVGSSIEIEEESDMSELEIKKLVPDRIPNAFNMYQDKMEASGHTRRFIADDGKNQYFEIFLWLEKEKIIRIDMHYDIEDDERLLSWKKDQEDLLHARVDPEKEKSPGIKQKQTIDGPADLNLEEIQKEWEPRFNETKKREKKNSKLISYLKEIEKKLLK
jgi:hypothetical protein